MVVKADVGVKVMWMGVKQRQKWAKTRGGVRMKVDLLWLGEWAVLLEVDTDEGEGLLWE